jgi:hypothetical protein
MLVVLMVLCAVGAALLLACGALAEIQELHEKHPPGSRLGWK